jgi:ABC-2 type transport system permease protein
VVVRQVETFQIMLSLGLLPLLFFSGAMFPPAGLPGWLEAVVKLNPLTYGVDAVRRTLPGGGALAGGQDELLLWGWHPPVVAELGLIAAVCAVALGLATRRFARSQ